jgi:cytochrome c oxidase subunit 2
MPSAVRKLTPSLLAVSGFALLSSGVAFAGHSPLGPVAPASPNARAISDLYWIVFGVAVGLFALVVVGLGGALLRSRRAAAVARGGAPDALTGRLVVLLAVVPAVALVAVAAVVFAKLSDAKDAPAAGPAGTLQVKVEAHQGGWQFTYPDGATATDLLRVPTGASVRLDLTSADVTHSWWVPALGGQVEVFPGDTAHTAFRADQDGLYMGHSTVPSGHDYDKEAISVEAMPKAEFDAWLASAAAHPKEQSGS